MSATAPCCAGANTAVLTPTHTSTWRPLARPVSCRATSTRRESAATGAPARCAATRLYVPPGPALWLKPLAPCLPVSACHIERASSPLSPCAYWWLCLWHRQSYAEGSSLKGSYVEDVAWIGSDDSDPGLEQELGVPFLFGCHSSENGTSRYMCGCGGGLSLSMPRDPCALPRTVHVTTGRWHHGSRPIR